MLRLVNVDENNWRIPVKVRECQKKEVAGRMELLARAYAYRNKGSRAFFIFEEEKPIGMGLYYEDIESERYVLSQFFIDEKYQNKGHGKTAMEKILEEMRREGKYQKVYLCYIEGNEIARKMYEKLGFRYKDREKDEILLEIDLWDRQERKG